MAGEENGSVRVDASATDEAAGSTRWRGLAVDVLSAGVVLAGTLVGTDQRQALVFVPPGTWLECLIFLTAGAAFVARTFPLFSLVTAAALDAAPHWLAVGGAGYHLSLMICVFMVVARQQPRVAHPAVAVVFVVQVGLMAWSLDWLWLHFFVLVTGLSVLFPAALGTASRARRITVRALHERADAAESTRDAEARKLVAEDRLRTARDLHDSVAHQIAVMNLNASVASRAIRTRPDDAERALVTVRDAGREVISSISGLLTSLREDNWTTLGPHLCVADLLALIEGFRALSPELEVATRIGVDEAGRPIDPALYAIVQEGLTNAYKHGRRGASVSLSVEIGANGSSVLVVNTAGQESLTGLGGFGLRGLRERVGSVGGTLEVHDGDGTFTLYAQLPGTGSSDD